MVLYILNAPILTAFGKYTYVQISVDEAKKLLENNEFISAIGHKGTAELLTKLLDIEIPANRIAIKMQVGDKAIVFQLLQRLEEGKVLTEEELKKIPFTFGLLIREV